MKKLLSFILLVTMLISLIACDDQGTGEPSSTSQTTTTTTTTTTTQPPNENPTPDDPNPDDPSPDDPNPDDPNPDDPNPDDSNQKVDFVACLSALLNGYKWNPASIIPDTMRPEYAENLMDVNSLNPDYSSFVSVSNIPKYGFGEQWNMTVENISQSQVFFSLLSVVDGLATSSVTAFNNYIDQNPSETAYYQFESGIYGVTIHCTKDTVQYVVEYTADLPVVGMQTVQIALSMDVETQSKTVRIQLGDANALLYTVDENHYTFAIKYLGVRRAYFEFTQNTDGTVVGHVYEYLTVSLVELASVCDFYITDDYVTVVGNKAGESLVFDGYICELYSVKNGRLIAYEEKQSLSVAGIGVEYNTLWFNLKDVEGINSIKYAPASDEDDEEFFYINGSSSAWTPKKYGLTGGLKSGSRRFDIEFRTQYFYYYDAVNDRYEKVAQQIPMLFVREDVYESLPKEVKEMNNVTVSVQTNATDLEMLKSEYASKIDLVKENKEKYSAEWIVEYIGDKKTIVS